MSYTTIELVQKHVIAPVSGETTTITVEVAVPGSAWIELHSGVIKAGSALVTALKSIAPQSEELVFNNSQAQSLLAPIAKGSVKSPVIRHSGSRTVKTQITLWTIKPARLPLLPEERSRLMSLCIFGISR